MYGTTNIKMMYLYCQWRSMALHPYWKHHMSVLPCFFKFFARGRPPELDLSV
jgi:hypothetical protein